MAPLTRARAGRERLSNDLMAEYYTQRASAGLIITEATVVSEQGFGWVDSPGIYSDAQVAGWRKTTTALHAKGTPVFLQLWHCGRDLAQQLSRWQTGGVGLGHQDSYGLQLWDRGQTEDALEVFENLIRLSPNDNLGVRSLAVGYYLELKEPSGVLSICRQFKNDAMEHVAYGKALALFQLRKVKQAEKALDIAIKCYPLIAAELLKTKHRRPKGISAKHVTLGGPDQAYVYWQDRGRYWKDTPGAMYFLRNRTL